MPISVVSPRSARRLAGAVLAFSAAGAHADGLADLKAALVRLAGTAPLRASVEVRTGERHGEGAEADTQEGQAALRLEDGPQGLQATWSRETLARMEAEAASQARDAKARTPARWAMARWTVPEMVPLASPAAGLARQLDEARLTGERVEDWHGRPARLRSFALTDAHLTEAQRKYVKHYEGTLAIWIGADGAPLASEQRERVSGRAFVVVGFQVDQDESRTYGVAGDRLYTRRRETHTVSSGAGERAEQRAVATLQPSP